MPKILHITASYKPAYIYGGPVISVSSLCEALAFETTDVTVLTTTANGKEDFKIKNKELKLINGVKVFYFHRKTKDHSHWSPSLLLFLYRNVKSYDIIHIHAWWNLVSMGAALVCKLRDKPFILSPRGTLTTYTLNSKKNKYKTWFHQFIGKRLLNKVNFQVSTYKESNDIKLLFHKPSIQVLPNLISLSPLSFINNDYINNSFYEKNKPLKLLFFSRIERKKGLNFLIKALNETEINFTLDIYGVGENNYIELLQEMIDKKNIDKIKWEGSVFGEKKFEILSSYDLLVLTSYDENFANVIVESLSTGTAVLITKGVGLSDFVLEKDLGWVCEQTIESINTTLNQITIERTKLDRIRKEAPSIIHHIFSKEVLIKEYIKYYQKFVS